jgi:hypothetical protein
LDRRIPINKIKGDRKMLPFQENIAEIHTKLQGVLGEKAWGVARGIGSFVTMEFGQPLQPEHSGKQSHGKWHLWVYGGEWRLEKGGYVIAASEDNQTKIEAKIQCIEGCIFQSFEVITPALDAVLTFEQEIVLRIFSIYSEETEDRGMDSWMLFTPDRGNVITIHAGGQWSYGL